jgi:linoleate 10R-lipoxygenase
VNRVTLYFALVYNDLPHPPATYIGHKYAWRSADGSNNNPCVPDMGKAGTPYSRSVQQTHPLPRQQMPDAGLIFDTLLKREGVSLLTFFDEVIGNWLNLFFLLCLTV